MVLSQFILVLGRKLDAAYAVKEKMDPHAENKRAGELGPHSKCVFGECVVARRLLKGMERPLKILETKNCELIEMHSENVTGKEQTQAQRDKPVTAFVEVSKSDTELNFYLSRAKHPPWILHMVRLQCCTLCVNN